MDYTLGRIGIIAYDAYDSTKTYAALDMVPYQGGSYIAKGATKGNLPTNTTYWVPVAQSAELRNSGTYIQWRVGANGTWNNLIALTELQGPAGPAGSGSSTFETNIRTGSATLSVNPKTGGTETITKTIAFDTPRSTVPKSVSVTTSDNFTALKFWQLATGNYTTTGFDLYMCRTETSTSTSGTVPIRYCAF